MEKNDSGGVGAKKGFLYQDYVAALHVVKMLGDKSIQSVRLEVSDDFDVVFEDYIEYVQVKTTKSDKSWSVDELTACSVKEEIGPRSGVKKIKNNDSIWHKSLGNDTEGVSKFKIVTPRPISEGLSYLKVKLEGRENKDLRQKLVDRLVRKVKAYTSDNGNGAEYWVDNTVWMVVPEGESLEALIYKEIIKSASDVFGVMLNPSTDPERILNNLLVNIIKKSAVSRLLYSEDKKTYFRKDFVEWFKNEILYYSSESGSKIKPYKNTKSTLIPILEEFLDNNQCFQFVGDKICKGVTGKYHLDSYQYESVARALVSWMPEVLLRASELSDVEPQKFLQKMALFRKRSAVFLSDLEGLASKTLMHSVVRTDHGSQPIPAQLVFEGFDGKCFDNVHIISNLHGPDKLLLGFSYMINGSVREYAEGIVGDFESFISSKEFASTGEKILEVKEDGYLVKHDVDGILHEGISLDENLDRFIFSFFIGYESEVLDCNKGNMDVEYKRYLIDEVLQEFKRLINRLVEEREFYKKLTVQVVFYPIPSVSRLIESFEKEVEVV